MKLRYRVGILLVVLVILGAAGITPARQAYRQSQLVNAEEQKLRALKSQNSELEQRLHRLKDEQYLEKLAREELGVTKPGEISYVIERPPPAPAPKPPPPKPFYEKAWQWAEDLFN